MSPFHRIRRLLIAGTAVGLALTACSSGDDNTDKTTTTPTTTTESSTPPTADGSVVWVDGFCGAVNGFVTDQNAIAAPAGGGTVEEIQRATSTHLGDYVTVLDKAIAALSALPPTTDPVAQEAARAATENYTTARDTAATAKTALDGADPNDVDAQNSAVDALIAAQEHAHKTLDPVSPLLGSPELTEAAATAPNCG